MDFLREPVSVSLAEPARGKHVCFAADLFRCRPPFESFEEISAWQQCAKELRDGVTKLMARRACPLNWLAFYIDTEGALMLAVAKDKLHVNNMRSALGKTLTPLPKEQQRSVADSLRPLDEADRDRIAAWRTLASVRPKGTKRKSRDDDEQLDSAPKRAKTLAEFLAEESSSDEGEDTAPPRRMLTNAPATTPAETTGPDLLDLASAWEYRAKKEATIILAETGERPAQIGYIRCHREPRRQLLLQNRVKDEYESPRMLDVVRVASQLANDGSIPSPSGEHGRRSEFVRRCAAALRAIDPKAVYEISELEDAVQTEIRKHLSAEKEQYEGCLNEACLDLQTTWVTKSFRSPEDPPGQAWTVSRCARCNLSKSYGRTFNCLGELLAPTSKRERGMNAMEWARYFS